MIITEKTLIHPDFITIIPNDKLDDLAYIQLKIDENRKNSIIQREHIRQYALKYFGWSRFINKYIEISTTPAWEKWSG